MISVRRALVAVVVIVLLVTAGIATARRPVDVRASRVERGAVERSLPGTGTLESESQVQLAFTIPGRIDAVLVQEGESIHAGDLLARVDPREHERQLALAARSTEIAAAVVTKSDAEIARAEVSYAAAQREAARVASLVTSGASPRATLDDAEERTDRARAELDAAKAARAQGSGGVAAAHASVAVHSLRKDEASLRSPLDGVVVRRVHEPGDVVGAGATVLVIASTRKIWARVWLDESALRDVREGQVATVTLRSDPARSLAGRLDRVAVEADRQTHEVLADVELLQRPARLVLGERVDATIVVERREAVLRVPRGACEVAGSRCLVDRGGVITPSGVQFGLLGNDWVEVVNGLAQEEVVLSAPDGRLDLPTGRRLRRSSP